MTKDTDEKIFKTQETTNSSIVKNEIKESSLPPIIKQKSPEMPKKDEKIKRPTITIEQEDNP